MANWFNKLIAASALAVSVSSAHAIVITGDDYTFNFTGNCTDCESTSTGELKLTNYVLGDDLTLGNLVSFSYTSSILGTISTVDNAPTNILGRFLTTDASPADFELQFGSFTFTSCDGNPDSSNSFNGDCGSGQWQVLNNNVNADFGRVHDFAVATVPEPTTLALMGLGLVGAGYRRRQTA